MKLLVSDYDYTIKPYEKNPNIIERNVFKNNIESINRFIKNGNKFVIATGRNTSSIKEEVDKYGINYNYLIAYNGRVIVDKDNNLIYANYIDENIIKYLEELNLIHELMLFDEQKTTEDKDKLIYIKAKLNRYLNIRNYIEELKSKYPNIKVDYTHLLNTLMIRNNFNKSLGIEELLKREDINIPNEKIYTVGDETNDIDMLKDYNGTRILLSNPALIFATNKTTPTVYSLIKRIEKNI